MDDGIDFRNMPAGTKPARSSIWSKVRAFAASLRAPEDLVLEHLQSICWRQRWFNVFTVLVAAGVVALLGLTAAMAADRVSEFGLAVRRAGWVTAAGSIAFAALFFLVRVWIRKPSTRYAARGVERCLGADDEALVTYVELAEASERSEDGQTALKLLAPAALERVRRVNADQVVNTRWLGVLGWVLAGFAACHLVLFVWWGASYTDTLCRSLLPWNSVPPPHSLRILEVLPGNAVVAAGEPVAFHITAQGGELPETAVVRWGGETGSVSEEVLPRGKSGVYSRELPGFVRSLDYRVRCAGKEQGPFHLTVVERPLVMGVNVRVYPPPGAPTIPVREADGGHVQAVRGSRLEISATVSTPPKSGQLAGGPPAWLQAGEKRIPMQTEGLTLKSTVTLERGFEYGVGYVDAHGLLSREGVRYCVKVLPAPPPQAALPEPVSASGTTPETAEAVKLDEASEKQAQEPLARELAEWVKNSSAEDVEQLASLIAKERQATEQTGGAAEQPNGSATKREPGGGEDAPSKASAQPAGAAKDSDAASNGAQKNSASASGDAQRNAAAGESGASKLADGSSGAEPSGADGQKPLAGGNSGESGDGGKQSSSGGVGGAQSGSKGSQSGAGSGQNGAGAGQTGEKGGAGGSSASGGGSGQGQGQGANSGQGNGGNGGADGQKSSAGGNSGGSGDGGKQSSSGGVGGAQSGSKGSQSGAGTGQTGEKGGAGLGQAGGGGSGSESGGGNGGGNASASGGGSGKARKVRKELGEIARQLRDGKLDPQVLKSLEVNAERLLRTGRAFTSEDLARLREKNRGAKSSADAAASAANTASAGDGLSSGRAREGLMTKSGLERGPLAGAGETFTEDDQNRSPESRKVDVVPEYRPVLENYRRAVSQ